MRVKFTCLLLGIAFATVCAAKSVRVSEIGFNPTNSTEFIQRAIDSDADTVVLDAMPTPWYVTSVTLRSDKRLVIRKGARVMLDKSRWDEVKKTKAPLFMIQGVKNVVVEGEGCGPDGSRVGHFSDYEERRRYCPSGQEIGHGFRIDRSTNTVIRNLHITHCGCDGVYFGWDAGHPAVNTLLEDLDLDDNHRQASSIVVADGVVMRRVRFRNTRGTEPAAGLDIEPNQEQAVIRGVVLEDCEFANNNGGGVTFPMCSLSPIDFTARRCRFLPQQGVCPIDIAPRCETYIHRRMRADVNLCFEDCTIESHANEPAIQFQVAPSFSCVFRNMKMKNVGRWSRWRGRRRAAPVEFVLNRDYTDVGVGFTSGMTGKAVFENVTAEGYAGPFVSFVDTLGMQPVENYFSGHVTCDGRDVDTAEFNHPAPDLREPRLERVPVAKLKAAVPSDMRPSNCIISWKGPWFQKRPEYTYYFYARKGTEVSFKLSYGNVGDKALAGRLLELETADGVKNLGPVKSGTTEYRYTAVADGWCSFRPPCQDKGVGGAPVTDVRGTRLAYQCDTLGDSVGKFTLADPKRDYTGYFEVPPGADCRLRVTSGNIELFDADGRSVGKAVETEYAGRQTFAFRAKCDKPEVWSFRTPPGGGLRTLRFYGPLNGIWADSPDALPLSKGH